MNSAPGLTAEKLKSLAKAGRLWLTRIRAKLIIIKTKCLTHSASKCKSLLSKKRKNLAREMLLFFRSKPKLTNKIIGFSNELTVLKG